MSTPFWIHSRAFPRPYCIPPITRRVPCSTWWPCLREADWRLRSDLMTNSRLQARPDRPRRRAAQVRGRAGNRFRVGAGGKPADEQRDLPREAEPPQRGRRVPPQERGSQPHLSSALCARQRADQVQLLGRRRRALRRRPRPARPPAGSWAVPARGRHVRAPQLGQPSAAIGAPCTRAST